MANRKLLEFTPEEEEMYKNALEETGVFVEAWGPGLRVPDRNDPAYKKWKEQNGKA